ncbi:MAG: hypothetical protein IH588_05800 [Anaerolineales bacterium]|nr:hypothetical protein [Anaerolineales bacterium]
MAKEKEDFTESVVSALRNFAGLLGLIGAASYVAGYLISNFYIGKFGGSAFNLVQSRYFATGGLFLVLTSLSLIGPAITFAIIDKTEKREKRSDTIKNAILIFLGFLLSAVTIWYSGIILTSVNSSANYVLTEEIRRTGIWLGLLVTSIALLTPILLYFVSKWVFQKLMAKKPQALPAWLSLVFGSLAIFLFIISLWLFSEFVYPYVPPAFGGNAPTKVQIILSDYLSITESLPIQHVEGISETVILIDQTPTSILIQMPSTGKVIEIPYSEVKGIIR